MTTTGRPLISVVIPLFNKRGYIAQAVRSVLAQTYEHFEVLVIDDGSTDGSALSIEGDLQDPRVRVIRQSNAGEGAARNRGLREMRGDIAAFLDADDLWLPRHLADLVDLASRFPLAGFFATGYRSVFGRGFTMETTLAESAPVLIPDYFAFATGAHPIHISSAAVRRTVAESVGGFAEGEPYGADVEFYARIAATESRVAYHPAVSGVYNHQLPMSAMTSFRWKAALPPVVRTIEACAATRDLPPSAGAYARWVLREYAVSGIAAGQKSAAIEMLRRNAASRAWTTLGARCFPQAMWKLAHRARRSRFLARREQRIGDIVVRRVQP